MRRHQQQQTAKDSGFCIVQGANTYAGDPGLQDLTMEVNQTLLKALDDFNVSPRARDPAGSLDHGVPSNFPPPLRWDKALKSKSSEVS